MLINILYKDQYACHIYFDWLFCFHLLQSKKRFHKRIILRQYNINFNLKGKTFCQTGFQKMACCSQCLSEYLYVILLQVLILAVPSALIIFICSKINKTLMKNVIKVLLFIARIGFSFIYSIKNIQIDPSKYRKNFKKSNKKPSFYISNHVSWIDILYQIIRFFMQISFVSKKEVQNIPIISFFAKLHKTIYVQRGNNKSGQSTLNQLRKRSDQVQKGQSFPVIIYPQGTTSNGYYILSFKNGAFDYMAPLRILCLKYTNSYFIPALDSLGGLTVLLFSLAQWHNGGICYDLGVIDPQANSLSNVQQFRQYCRDLMAQVLQLPKSESSYRQKEEYYKRLRQYKAQ